MRPEHRTNNVLFILTTPVHHLDQYNYTALTWLSTARDQYRYTAISAGRTARYTRLYQSRTKFRVNGKTKTVYQSNHTRTVSKMTLKFVVNFLSYTFVGQNLYSNTTDPNRRASKSTKDVNQISSPRTQPLTGLTL